MLFKYQDIFDTMYNDKITWEGKLKAKKRVVLTISSMQFWQIMEENLFKDNIIGPMDNKNISLYPANTYLFQVSNKNTRKRCEICSKLAIKTPEQR